MYVRFKLCFFSEESLDLNFAGDGFWSFSDGHQRK